MGQVSSWTYTYSRGWEPSDKLYCGIPHIEAFGVYTRLPNIISILEPLIQPSLESKGFVKWQTLAEAAPSLKHLRTSVIHKALESLAVKVGFEVHGETTDKLILLKSEAHEISYL